jgi:hypothetical protein
MQKAYNINDKVLLTLALSRFMLFPCQRRLPALADFRTGSW